MKPTLVIMAAGMGSRFGGLKQLTPVGPHGQLLIDYSIYDAIESGFGKIVFVIKHAIEKEFKELLGNRIAAKFPVEYVYQELDKLPEGYTVPEGRTKPWGTGHAILCCRGVVKEPFMVINADDFYGRESYRILAEFLSGANAENGKMQFAMSAYTLENTLTENGYVSRGICSVDEQGKLCGLVERTHIELVDGKAQYSEDDGKTWKKLGNPVYHPCGVHECLGVPCRDVGSPGSGIQRVFGYHGKRKSGKSRVLSAVCRERYDERGQGGNHRVAHA